MKYKMKNSKSRSQKRLKQKVKKLRIASCPSPAGIPARPLKNRTRGACSRHPAIARDHRDRPATIGDLRYTPLRSASLRSAPLLKQLHIFPEPVELYLCITVVASSDLFCCTGFLHRKGGRVAIWEGLAIKDLKSNMSFL
ncbi:hypothetical protein LXL04_009031 [Taraxacum kok-saghyz]